MTVLLIVSLGLFGVSAGLAARAVALPRIRALERLDAIANYGILRGAAADEERLSGSLITRLATHLGILAVRRFDRIDPSEARTLLLAAGYYGMRPETFVGYRIVAVPMLGALGLAIVGTGLLGVVQAAVIAGGGWVLPLRLLRLQASRRAETIDDSLPDLVDLLVVTVEAGLTFSSSLQVAAQRMTGPLGEEIRLVMQEQRMGLPVTTGLANMLERVDTDAMRSFVRSVVQGESMGVSIGTILRNVADEMRKRRRARAEERANKAPVKILFPLVFLIFPSLFVIILAPGAMELIRTLGDL